MKKKAGNQNPRNVTVTADRKLKIVPISFTTIAKKASIAKSPKVDK
jgi:hypothetical protein